MSKKFETSKRKAAASTQNASVAKKIKSKAVVAPVEDSDSEELGPEDFPSSGDDLDSDNEDQDSADDDSDEEANEDKLDVEDADEDAEEEEGEGENGEDENRKSKQEQNAEKKRLKEERRMSRPNGAKIQQIKHIWERLRVKAGVTPEERKSLVNEIWDLVHDSVKELVLKHDASRVIQTIFKYADKKKRVAITKSLKGSYVELAKSAYGKYLLVKLLHYGSAEVREDVHNELHGNFRKLMRHKEGAYVIEDAYRDYATAAQKRQMIREFYGSEFAIFKDHKSALSLSAIIAEQPDKRPFLMKNLYDTIASSVQKGSIGFTVIHAAMLEYVKSIDPKSSEREDFIQLIIEQFAEIVHTNEGSQVACLLLAMATAKERRQLVKTLRPFASKMAEDEYGHFVLITLFNTVDDTVMVSRALIPDLKENIASLIVSKNGRRPFLYLLCGRTPRYFAKHIQDKFAVVDEAKKETSKKDDEARWSELNKAFSPMILEAVAVNAVELLKNNFGAQFISEALLYGDGDKTAAIDAVCLAVSGSPEAGVHPIHDAVVSRTLRALVQGGHWNVKTKAIETVESADPEQFRAKLLQSIEDYVVEWATGEGAFVIVALLESSQGDANTQLRKSLKAHKKAIKASESKGSKLVLEQL